MVSVDSFIQARNYHQGRLKAVRLIVLHDMETDELLSTAEDVGHYFAGPNAPQASAHTGVDADSTVGYVHTEDTAFAVPNANADGYHIEQAGRARQSRAEWLDDFSRATIKRAAKTGFDASLELLIPRVQLTVAQVADGVTKGFTDHRTCTIAFGTAGGHTDPGEFYPWDVYLDDMAALAAPFHQEDEVGQGDAWTFDGKQFVEVGRGLDDDVWIKRWNADTARFEPDWAPIPATLRDGGAGGGPHSFTGAPSVAAGPGGRFDVCVRGVDGAIWRNTLQYPAWSGWFSDGGGFH